MQEEIWRDIPNYEGKYQVSNKGGVMSLNYRKTGCKKIRKPFKTKHGYYALRLCKNGIEKYFEVHQLVAITFLGHKRCGIKLVVDHIDFDKENNNVSNLQIISFQENLARSGKRKRKLKIKHR